MALPNRLIGRDEDCARSEKLVAGGGIVTLIGPGGVGKTRLALELARWREEYGEAVPIAHLADLRPDASDAAVAAALGYESVEAAIIGLEEHGGIVVLDNCEHVVGAVEAAAHRAVRPASDGAASRAEPLRKGRRRCTRTCAATGAVKPGVVRTRLRASSNQASGTSALASPARPAWALT